MISPSKEPKYKTLAFDSAGDMARLYFSFDMKKHSKDMESIRALNNWPGATERLNMLVRRLKNFRKAGMEIVFVAHEDVEKLYLKGSGIPGKGQPAQEPYAMKGWADLPGRRAPDEFGRAVDNLLHVRRVSGRPQWVAARELIGPGAEWDVKDRFNAPAITQGYLPTSYSEVARLASANPLCNWQPPYIWLLYGALGIGKTRSLITFPSPICIFDFDRGSTSITQKEREEHQITVLDYDSEECDDYNRFLADLEACMP